MATPLSRLIPILVLLALPLGLEQSANAQRATAAPSRCYINVATGKPVPMGDIGPFDSHLDEPGHASITGPQGTVGSYVQGADGSWTNVATGQPVPDSDLGPFDSHPDDADHASIRGPQGTVGTYVRVPCPPPPPPPSIRTSWSGLFGGGYIVGALSSVTTTEELAATGTVTHKFDDCCSGVGGGLNLGYDWQLPNAFVLGGVADIYFPNDRVSHPFGGGTFLRSTVDFTATFQARAGLVAMPNLLLYAQTGLAVGNQNLKVNVGGPVSSRSDTSLGVTLGGGAEWLLFDGPTGVIGRSPSLFLEYGHIWWDDAHFNTPAASPLFNYTWSRASNVIKAGLRVRF